MRLWPVEYYCDASISVGDRETRLAVVYNEIEENLALIGASAVEDKLQNGVPEAIANLTLAQMKIWILTGDKQGFQRGTQQWSYFMLS